MLDSTDGDLVTELVGALKTKDLIAIQKWEQIHKDAKGYPHKFALLIVCIFF